MRGDLPSALPPLAPGVSAGGGVFVLDSRGNFDKSMENAIMAEVLEQIEGMVATAQAELAAVKSADQLEQFRIKWLGAKGIVKSSMKLLGTSAQGPEARRRPAAKCRRSDSDHGRLQRGRTEVYRPGRCRPRFCRCDRARPPAALGNKHILMKVVDELTDLFGRMGFAIASGPEVEDEFHNFVALNIPESHPARDPLDNFYIARIQTHSPETRTSKPEALQAPPHSNQHRPNPRHGDAAAAYPRGDSRPRLSARYARCHASFDVPPA